MNRKLLLQEVADAFAQRANISKKKAEAFCRTFFDLIEEELTHESFVKIKGFGTFKVITVNERESININTGERIRIDSHAKLSFVPDSQLKDLINKPFADFQTITLQDRTTEEELTKAEIKIEREISTSQSLQQESTFNQKECYQKEIDNNSLSIEPIGSTNHQKDNLSFQEASNRSVKEDTCLPDLNTGSNDLSSGETIPPPPTQTETSSNQDFPSQSKSRWLKRIAIFSIFILQAIFCYYAGYYRWLCPYEKKTALPQSATGQEMAASQPQSSPQMQSKKTESSNHKQETIAEADTINYDKAYPQLPGGRFQIIGTLSTHELQKGENIYHLAKEVYGDKSYAIYIFTFNQLKNPDLVPIGTKLKLPKLRKRIIKK
ncbi:HU family DNA-binding protein [Alloprevotella tannerae]|uniref:HU family DNA-binding protein n=1 Tax=Alloprevotella tannerae TaxID=76122 RepID=UPI0028EB9057|nr:HU family DNA-binding protein [Alloprevotella tannerae]